jgi:16S rRNA (cytosine967-C5)-methyltransferase
MRASPIAPARLAAFEILSRIAAGSGHSDELLRTRQVDALSVADRNLCTNLVMGTLRWQSGIDARVSALLSRPRNAMHEDVRLALRLGAFQLLHLDRIPIHAAIGESVELAKRSESKYAAGMVNAVLRKLAAAPRIPLPERLANAGEVAAAYAHPAWLVERWANNYGLEAAQKICRFDQEPAPATVRLFGSDAAECEEALKREGVELAPGQFLTQARRVLKGDVTATVTYQSGRVRIQDEGSQLIAELAGTGERILDCCAAPGGKTAILAERNPDAEITACDVSARRLEQMKGLRRGLPGASRVKFQVADAAALNFENAFDLVLCDAPCSGTGTIARNPEIRQRVNDASLLRHQRRQSEILRSALGAVRSGGRLLYSTCSLEPEENEAVIAACMQEQREFHVSPLEPELGRMVATGATTEECAALLRISFAGNFLRILPGDLVCDGFFAAMIERE